MFPRLRGLDHAVILVRDLDAAAATYRRLGFTLTPRGHHSLGSQNHCIMFGGDYLELMALPAVAPPAFQYFADFLARREGVGALALATDDAGAAYAELLAGGIAAEPPMVLSRPVERVGEARFTLVQLPPDRTPGFRTFVCQHHTREIVWRPEHQQHAAGVTGVASIGVSGRDRADYGGLLDSLPVQFAAGSPPAVTSLRLRVRDRALAEAALRSGGFAVERLADGALAVDASAAHGVTLVFD